MNSNILHLILCTPLFLLFPFSRYTSPMQRVAFILSGIVAVVLLGFGAKHLFSVPEDLPSPVESGETVTSSSLSSSLHLIVRVSPLLKKAKPHIGESSSARAPQMTSAGIPYVPYLSRSSVKGKRAVLFFLGIDDPFSEEHHVLIQSLVASSELKVPTFRIDFATATGARIEYAVVVPDTFVLVDASGARVQSLIHPTTDELKKFLTSSHP